MLIRIGVLGAVSMLAGCSSLEPKDFAQTAPGFDPVAYFAGHASAWGVMEDGSGNPTKSFRSEDDGRREGDGVLIDQTIRYSDGEVQKRSWKLRRIDEHHFEGTADDIVGVAEGEADGNVLRLSYTVAPSATNPLTHVHLNQWLYLQADGRTVLSRTTITKLGVVVVRVAEYVRRDGVAADGPAAPAP